MEQDFTSIEKMVDNVSPISSASAPAFFAEKVMHRLHQINEPPPVWYQWILAKPALVTITLSIFFLINCWTIASSFKKSSQSATENTAQLQQLSVDLNITSENNLPYK
ncbi:MAG: hypothetical protein FGM61_03220 [Sediminibacterium sp.]|nr:hypothetical protein [Sediminibacterium sp.]